MLIFIGFKPNQTKPLHLQYCIQPPRTHDVTEGGILVLDPPPHFMIANQTPNQARLKL